MAHFQSVVSFRDSKGQISRFSWSNVAGTSALAQPMADAVFVTLTPLSSCVVSSFIGPDASAVGAFARGGNVYYATGEDKARMQFVDNHGCYHHYEVPSPKSAIFLSDQETVDPANALVAAFVTAMLAQHVCGRSELQLTAFIAGTRARRRTNRRFNYETLNPALGGPAL